MRYSKPITIPQISINPPYSFTQQPEMALFRKKTFTHHQSDNLNIMAGYFHYQPIFNSLIFSAAAGRVCEIDSIFQNRVIA